MTQDTRADEEEKSLEFILYVKFRSRILGLVAWRGANANLASVLGIHLYPALLPIVGRRDYLFGFLYP